MKTPTGRGIVSKNQENYLKQLDHNGFMTLVSCDYDEIITTIIKYSLGIRYTISKIRKKDIPKLKKKKLSKIEKNVIYYCIDLNNYYIVKRKIYIMKKYKYIYIFSITFEKI